MTEPIRCERCLGAGVYLPDELQVRILSGDEAAKQSTSESISYWMERALDAEKRADLLQARYDELKHEIKKHNERLHNGNS